MPSSASDHTTPNIDQPQAPRSVTSVKGRSRNPHPWSGDVVWTINPDDAQAYDDHKNTPYFQENVFGYILEYLAERSVKTYETIDA